METSMTGLPFIVFDVNETLLDLESLTPTFERIFGDRAGASRRAGAFVMRDYHCVGTARLRSNFIN
jgi:hypothetical protein